MAPEKNNLAGYAPGSRYSFGICDDCGQIENLQQGYCMSCKTRLDDISGKTTEENTMEDLIEHDERILESEKKIQRFLDSF